MVNFTSIMDKKVEETERPPLPPIGTYRMMVFQVPQVREGDAFDIIDFPLRAVEAMDDVDAEELEAFGDITNVVNRRSFLFDKNDATSFAKTEFQLKQFLENHLQIDGAEKMSYKEAFANAVNHQCLATIIHKADKNDPETQHANIRSTAPAD